MQINYFTSQPAMNRNNTIKQFNNIFVGDLDEAADEISLHSHFSKFGPIASIQVRRDPLSNKSKGNAMIIFQNAKSAENAIMQASGDFINQKPIRVMSYRNPKEWDNEANVFVLKLDPSITAKELHGFFSQFGNIFSTKISTDGYGNSNHYGYVQFEKRQDAEACLQQETYDFKGQTIQVTKFVPRTKREIGATKERKNLYITDLPYEQDPKDLTDKLRAIFEAYGEVVSLSVKQDEKSQKAFAFVCFSEENAAQNSVTAAENDESAFAVDNVPFKTIWAQSKDERNEDNSDSNLFTKNIKMESTEEELKVAFEYFGQILSMKVQKPAASFNPITATITKETKFAFVNYANKESASKAIALSATNTNIKALFDEGKVYISPFQSKEVRQQFLKTKKKSQQAFQQQQMPQMFPGQMPGMMPMGYGRGGMQPYFPAYFMPPMYGGYQQRGGYQKKNQGGYQKRQNNSYEDQRDQSSNQGSNVQQRQQYDQQNPQQQQYRQNYNKQGNYQNQNRNYQNRGNYNNQGQNQVNYQQNGNRRGPYNNRPQDQQQNRQQQQGLYNNQQQQNKPVEGGVAQQQSQISSSHQQSQGSGVAQPVIPQSMIDSLISSMQSGEEGKQKVWTFFGNQIYPLVQNIIGAELAPKITGMLVDFNVFNINEICEMLNNKAKLTEQVEEARRTIETPTDLGEQK